ncbi:hypothetical protein P5G86_24150 [Paenibacillus jamilae]|uniref:hypothetical protein n=1 Tax=Bacillus cereus group TaxID=86661 RepID=UPI001298AB44|nr:MULTISPECIES: hypothetical protein [Bacillus cereus group]MEB4843086.1 hypothetical protein [Paenibacillus jamilae]MEB8830917.1 hypothetical protein [Bacillus cereus]MCR6856604.1 hypothetical protein [Bacillus thuringiensis]MEB9274907.1 hypothetical protein [Bacillus cereus]MEC3037298.1 hypothetical protein [Bacillus cereus]
MRFLLVRCIKDVVTTGRNGNSMPDHCFIKEKEYDMCLDERKNECFTLNEIKKMHFFGYKNNWYFNEHFEIVKELQDYDFKGVEIRLHKLKGMAEEKHDFQEFNKIQNLNRKSNYQKQELNDFIGNEEMKTKIKRELQKGK